jgi:hypothetical protein
MTNWSLLLVPSIRAAIGHSGADSDVILQVCRKPRNEVQIRSDPPINILGGFYSHGAGLRVQITVVIRVWMLGPALDGRASQAGLAGRMHE